MATESALSIPSSSCGLGPVRVRRERAHDHARSRLRGRLRGRRLPVGAMGCARARRDEFRGGDALRAVGA